MVVAVFGIVAAAAMVGLNPLEQVRKSRDAGSLSRAKQIFSAAEAHYAFFQVDPADCSVLDLKPATCVDMTLLGSNGHYQVDFEVESNAFEDTCGSTTCTVPDDFI